MSCFSKNNFFAPVLFLSHTHSKSQLKSYYFSDVVKLLAWHSLPLQLKWRLAVLTPMYPFFPLLAAHIPLYLYSKLKLEAPLDTSLSCILGTVLKWFSSFLSNHWRWCQKPTASHPSLWPMVFFRIWDRLPLHETATWVCKEIGAAVESGILMTLSLSHSTIKSWGHSWNPELVPGRVNEMEEDSQTEI